MVAQHSPWARGPSDAGIWRASELSAGVPTVASGHAALDCELPGGGWPLGSLTEILQPSQRHGEWRLLAPALVQHLRLQPGVLVLVAPPHLPYAPALAALGLPVQRLVCVHSNARTDRLWAAEQALRCTDVAAVLLWVDAVQTAALRRLQLAAQARMQLFFLLRDLQAQGQSSPAPLRVALEFAQTGTDHVADGLDTLEVRLLKRRGPPLLQRVLLPARAAPIVVLWSLGRTDTPPLQTLRHDVLDSPAASV